MTDIRKDIITEKKYTKREIADLLRVTVITVGNYIKSGKLHAVKISNGRVLIPETALNEFLENYTEIK